MTTEVTANQKIQQNPQVEPPDARRDESSASPYSLEKAEIITGADNVLAHQVKVLSRTCEKIHSCIEKSAASAVLSIEPIREAIIDSLKRGVKHKYVTEITAGNLSFCKKLIELGIEIRHLSGVKGNFAVTENEYTAVSTLEEARPLPQLIYSNAKQIVEQHEYLFETLWNHALAADSRITEIEEGRSYPRETKIIHNPEEIINAIRDACETSLKSLSFCTDFENLVQGQRLFLESYKKALQNHRLAEEKSKEDESNSPSPSHFRWLVQIERQNSSENNKQVIDAVRGLLELGIDLRHLDTPPLLKFALKDSKELYATFEAGHEGSTVANVLFSNEEAYVSQFEAAFEEAWRRSIDARQRIKEIEEGKEPLKTTLLTEPSEILKQVKTAMEKTSRVCSFTNAEGLRIALGDLAEEYKQILDRKKGAVRILLPIESRRDVDYVKKGLEIGLEIKHVDQKPQPSFSVLDRKLFTTMDRMEAMNAVNHLLMSNVPLYIEQYQSIFEEKWRENSIDAAIRIKEIEERVEPEKTEIIRNVYRAAEIAKDCFLNCEKEILIILATQQVVARNLSLFQEMIDASVRRNVKVKILLPTMNPEYAKFFQKVDWRAIDRMNVGYAIYDRKKMLITQYALQADDHERDFSAIQSNIFTTNREHISGIVSVFDALWRESDLRQTAERSKKRAELLQDILSHDMRNYNQIIKLSAELLQREVRNDDKEEVDVIISNMLSAIDGSSSLLEKAKKIGKVISEENPILHEESLLAALDRSIELVRKANPRKKVEETRAINSTERVLVKADDMLAEVFTNIFGNSVKYTDSNEVKIRVQIDTASEVVEGGKSQQEYWKVSMTDWGSGIPEETKKKMFDRYLSSAKGTGLGMSIVRALVADRYKGKIHVKDRVPGDYTKGTVVEVILPKV